MSAALQRRLDAALAEQAELNRQLDLASAENRRLSEHRSHWMQQTEREQEARRAARLAAELAGESPVGVILRLTP